jgi:TrmH family RNA methyltransferase
VALRGGVPTGGGAVGVEGVRLVEEALGSGCKIEAVLFSESGEKHRERLASMISRRELAFPVLRTTDRLFEGIADTEHPQGVAALVVPRVWTLEDVLRQRFEIRNSKIDIREEGQATMAGVSSSVACEPLLVVLAGVQDPGNVGTILRTAAAFGATGAITAATGQSGTASPFSPKALRASAGAALHLPVVSGMALGILLTQLKLNGIRTLATCVDENPPFAKNAKGRPPATEQQGAGRALRVPSGQGASTTSSRTALLPWEVNWCEASALLVGNEGAGLPEDVVKSADACVHIPMARTVESLNAAGATAVLLYEAFRQRTSRKVEE